MCSVSEQTQKPGVQFINTNFLLLTNRVTPVNIAPYKLGRVVNKVVFPLFLLVESANNRDEVQNRE